MAGILLEYHYPIFTMILFALVLAFVPKSKMGPLFWASLLWGFFFSIVFFLIFGKLFGLFHYNKAYPFTFLGSPIWLNIAWIGTIMLYLRFLPTRKMKWIFPVYLFIFSFAGSTLDVIFHQIGMLVYTGWNPFYRFLIELFWFYGAALHQLLLEEAELKKETDEER